ncbi:MAG: hypothetical protein AAFU67_09370, partial [Bacteroidota bacterium]
MFCRATLLLLITLLCSFQLSAQEVCDNGIDDDADGLIDLNDTTDCNCQIIDVVESLLPNPSFDIFENDEDCRSRQTNGAPDGPGQANCIAEWQQASDGTTDAWHLLTYNSNPPFWPDMIPQPIPGGLGVAGLWVGLVDPTPDLREYLGACLADGPLAVGEEYRLNFFLGFLDGEPFSPDSLIHSPPTTMAIYGITNCDFIPFAGDLCPEFSGAEGWELITTFPVDGMPNSWEEFSIDFTVDFPYAGIALGGSCDPVIEANEFIYWRNYYFIDEIRLNTQTTFEQPAVGPIEVFGTSVCDEDANMLAQEIEGAIYQWYRNGIAISGATSRSYYPPLDQDFPGLYSVRITTDEGCGIAGPVELIRPIVTNTFQDSVALCPDGTATISPTFTGVNLIESFLWEDGSTNSTLVVSTPGIYQVTVTSFCEQVIESIVVVEDQEPTYNLIVDPPIFCPGDEVRLFFVT